MYVYRMCVYVTPDTGAALPYVPDAGNVLPFVAHPTQGDRAHFRRPSFFPRRVTVPVFGAVGTLGKRSDSITRTRVDISAWALQSFYKGPLAWFSAKTSF